MAGGSHEPAGAASSSGSYYATTVAAHKLRRQRSVPAVVFGPCGGASRGGYSTIHLGSGGGDGNGQCAPVACVSAGGVSAVARALWAWVVKGRRKVLTRSRSSAKEQYGHEEYAQNFDEGAAAAEPENLSRSFSARFARRRLAR